MIVLAKYEDDKLIPADNLVHIKFSQKIDHKLIESNMYYHLKYNDISLDVLKFKSVKPRI